MLNTEKLLYILPDLAYLAELLPGKKEHEYVIQSFKQINGEFINQDEFIANNIQKLFTKIDKDESYHLILPDFLFTNTIVNVDDESESNAISYVQKKLLPDLNLNEDTHQIKISVLTSFKGKSRVQISAIEKELLAPIQTAIKKSEKIIEDISPLSWTIKSIVSLEPSITVLQVGGNLYSAQHYIGIDQTNNFPVDEFAAINETIKTLKGAEPSIQTIYLASSSLVEKNLKEDLSGTLPIQQLATYKESDSKIPSYLKYIIESCMKTLSISDFPVPKFDLGKISENKEVTETENNKSTAQANLPEPSKIPEIMASAKIEEIESMSENKTKEVEEKAKDEETVEPEAIKPEAVEPEAAKTETKAEKVTPSEDETESLETKEVEEKAKDEETVEPEAIKPEAVEPEVVETDVPKTAASEDETENIDLAQFAGKEDEPEDDDKKVETKDEKKAKTQEEKPTKKDSKTIDTKKEPQKVIKNSSGVNNMLKMVFITLAVFFITIAIGIGVGLGLLKMSDKTKEDSSPVVVVEPEATPEETASPTPEPVEEINKEELSILVVNATTKAGYAGKVKTLLVDNEITDITAGNAKGDYDDKSDYLLVKEENDSLKKLLEKATDLEFEYDLNVDVEDPNGKYDAIIVLTK